MIPLGEVVLRPLEPRDVDSLYSFRNDWEVIQYLGGFSAGYSRKNLQEWVTAHRNRADEVLWTIADARSDRSLGHVGLYKVDNRVRKAEFAIVIGDKNSWGKGLGRKVTEAVVDWGFEQLNLRKVSLSVLAFNRRALLLYRSLGFRQEGVLRDEQFRGGRYHHLVLMSVLDKEWRARKRPRR